MKQVLKNKIALVTGASKGIGRAIALRLAKDGAHVVTCARNQDLLGELHQEIVKAGGQNTFISADATLPDSVQKVYDMIEPLGRLDILINNVGGAVRFADFFDLSREDWEKAFSLNVMGLVYFVKVMLSLLKRSESSRIINMSSISGIEPGTYNPHYTSMKAAVINLTKYLANRLAKDKILVNVVCSGPVYSHAWDENIKNVSMLRGISVAEAEKCVEKEESAKIPLGRIGKGEELAGLVSFLSSDEATWITGSCFHIDGGKTRSI